MADTLSEVREFLRDLPHDLTNLHVTAAQYQNEPTDPKAVEALAAIPAGLLDRAQNLAARLDAESADDGDEKPKAAAKRSATKR